MKRQLIVIMMFFLVLGMTVTGAGNAVAAEWALDMAHATIYFDIQHIYSTIRGNFTEFAGTLSFDPDNLSTSNIDITVQTKSVNTQIPKRDNHLRSKDFFAVSDYPTMRFKSDSIAHSGGDKYVVKGSLTVKDVTQKIEVPFVFHGPKDHPMQKGKSVAGFDAQFRIDRVAYHVGDGSFVKMGVIGKDVDIYISFEALREN